MDSPKKRQQPTAGASPKKPASTLLDAYEVECIRRELGTLLLKQNAGEVGAAASSSLDAAAEVLGLRCRRSRLNRKKTVSGTKANPAPAPAPAPPTKKLHLGKHAAMICGGAVATSSAGSNNGPRPRRAGYREVEKV